MFQQKKLIKCIIHTYTYVLCMYLDVHSKSMITLPKKSFILRAFFFHWIAISTCILIKTLVFIINKIMYFYINTITIFDVIEKFISILA